MQQNNGIQSKTLTADNSVNTELSISLTPIEDANASTKSEPLSKSSGVKRPSLERASSSPSPAAPEPPKEDFQAWLRVLGAWLLFVAAWGPATAYGAFELYYSSTLLSHYSPSQLAWIGSLVSCLLVCTGVVAGPLFDRGYLKHILVLGCTMMVFALMMLSLSRQYYQVMLSQGLCFSIGAGCVYVPALAFVTSSFSKHRAYAVGVTTTGAAFGGLIFPIMFLKLQPQIGFAWTCRVFGFVDLALSIAGIALVWSAPTKVTKPRKILQLSAFTEPAYLMLAVAFFLQFLAYWIPIFYIPVFSRSALGVGPDLSIYAVAIFNAANILGRLAPMFLIAKFGAVNVVFASTVATTVIFFCWIAVNSYAGFVVWCVSLGFTSGVFVSGNPVIAAHPQISALTVLGTRLGQLWLCAGIGALIGTPISGALTDVPAGNFLKSQVFVGCILAGTVLAFLYPLWRLNAHDREAKKERR